MNWVVRYAEEAKQDIKAIYQYIAFELNAEETAQRQYHRILDAIQSLEAFPLRQPLYKEEPWLSMGMRWLRVDNYLVFYFVDETVHGVNIARVMYGGRDIASEL